MPGRSDTNAISAAGDLAEAIAYLYQDLQQEKKSKHVRLKTVQALEEKIRKGKEELRRLVPGPPQPRMPLEYARRSAEIFEWDVEASHRPYLGRSITAAKRTVIRALKPFHVEILRKQRDFNFAVLKLLTELSAPSREAGLRPKVQPSDRVGFGTLWLKPVLARQARWNRKVTEILSELRQTGAASISKERAKQEIAELSALVDPLTGPWRAFRELFRRQVQFNSQVMLALCDILESRPPPETTFPEIDYPAWCLTMERPQIQQAGRTQRLLKDRPLISIVLPAYQTPRRFLIQSIESVLDQSYSHWELCVVDDGSGSDEVAQVITSYAKREPRIRFLRQATNRGIALATQAALTLATGEWVAFLDHDDTLAPHALAEIAGAIASSPTVELWYSDEDRLNEKGQRCLPFFKPDWSPDLLRTCNYICHLVTVKHSLLKRAGGLREGFDGSQDYEMLLRLSEGASGIGHVPKILYHWRINPASFSKGSTGFQRASEAGGRALSAHLQRMGEAAKIESEGTEYHLRYPIKGKPLVSIIVPFRDKPELLKVLIPSLLAKTDYRHFEILLVSNNSTRPETEALLKTFTDPRVRQLTWNHPFNYPAVNNWAVKQAKGSLLLFLNNDIEVLDGSWLGELMGQAQRREVGAVGAKLLFPDGTIQHAGAVVGLGGFAGHPFWRLPDAHQGLPFGSPHWTRNYSAVTSACMMIRKKLFAAIGGYDERFQVCGSDIELCLRLVKQGLRIVYASHCQLIHHESASRRLEIAPSSDDWLSFLAYRKWLEAGDPHYNLNLTLNTTDCSPRTDSMTGLEKSLRILAHHHI